MVLLERSSRKPLHMVIPDSGHASDSLCTYHQVGELWAALRAEYCGVCTVRGV